MKKKLATSLLGVFSLLLMSFATLAQNYTIKGKIADSDGQPMVGATVVLKGTVYGTATNALGDYNFEAKVKPGTYDLEFRSIGYANVSKKITLGSANDLNVNVAMVEAKDGISLDEVVVTGSTLKTNRRELGNAIGSVSSKQLEATGTANLTSALQGKIPGAQITQNSGDPAGGFTIRMRGVKSIRGNSDPLYVIDGVIVSNASDNVSQLANANQIGETNPGQNRLADINANDIESLNVLNGAAASAIYGSRASNGVIIITTKRGKSGAPKVTFSTSFNVNELRKKVAINTYGKQFGSNVLRLHTIQAAVPAGLETIGIERNGVISKLASGLVDVNRYDYQDQIFRTGYGSDNTISVSGGTDKTQYYASASYLKNEGIVKGTDFTRYGLKMRVDQRLSNWIKASAGLNYINSYANEKANGNVFYSPINSINITNNIWDITQRDANGKLLSVEPTRVNPLSTIEDMDFNQSVSRTIADVQFNFTPIKDLSVDLIIGVDNYSQLGRNTILPYPYQAISGLPAGNYPNGYAGNATNNVTLFNTDLNITYAKDLTKDLKLTAIAGMNYQSSRKDFTSSSGEKLVPGLTTVSAVTQSLVAGYGLDRFEVAGQFGQVTLGLKNRLFLTGAIRRDGSTLFSPSQTNQLYPKLSASYVISDEDFWKSLASTVSSAKLRASYGESGGLTAIGTYDRFWQFTTPLYLGQSTFLSSTRYANPDVRPERTKEIEFGADLGFLNDRITLGLSIYNQQTTDLVVNRTVAPTSGGLSIITNAGTMENRGVEIALGITPIKTKDLSWDLNLIYSANRNKILSFNTGEQLQQVSTASGAPVFNIAGQPAGVFYGAFFARNADGSFLNTTNGAGYVQQDFGKQNSALDPLSYTVARDANGQPLRAGNIALRKVIGNPNPDYTASVVSNLMYKNLGFRMLFDAVQGLQVFNADKRTRQGVGIGNVAEQELKGELPRGYIFSTYLTEEWRIDDGSFVKLREVSLSYKLPNIIKGMSGLKISVTGRNLISWDNYNGYDPETNAGGNSDRLRGVDFGNVPIPKTYQLSLTANF
jgi:TonB-linked SusC/RagA family outer membrane protein